LNYTRELPPGYFASCRRGHPGSGGLPPSEAVQQGARLRTVT